MKIPFETYTGRQFDLADPKLSDIDLADIARGLSLTCRYGGQCAHFYSVAQHCVLMMDEWWKHPHATVETALAMLFHDAAEAYIHDVTSPLKSYLGKRYTDLHDQLLDVIFRRFGLPHYAQYMDRVHDWDVRIRVDEALKLKSSGGKNWESLEGVRPLGVSISQWSPLTAEAEFTARAQAVMNAHARRLHETASA